MHPFYDPIVGMTYLAAHTTSIKLGLGILILPQRHPVQLAKELATLDILSDGRLLVGIGVGYLEAEYRAVGVDFTTRVARHNEYAKALRVLWTADPPVFEGTYVTLHGVDAYPRPQTEGGPPCSSAGMPARRSSARSNTAQGGSDSISTRPGSARSSRPSAPSPPTRAVISKRSRSPRPPTCNWTRRSLTSSKQPASTG